MDGRNQWMSTRGEECPGLITTNSPRARNEKTPTAVSALALYTPYHGETADGNREPLQVPEEQSRRSNPQAIWTGDERLCDVVIITRESILKFHKSHPN